MLYVYGVVRSGQPPVDVEGIGDPPGEVRIVESGPLAAAVSEFPHDAELQDDDARAHLHVLIRLLEDGPVVPLRMGTVAPDDDAVRAEVLDGPGDALRERLDALDGLVELHVDAEDDEAGAIAAVARDAGIEGRVARDFDARLELGEQIAELLVDRRMQLADEILAQLRPSAVADVPRSMLESPEDPVLRWAFLVNRADLDAFDRAIVEVRSRYPAMAIRYVGPLPAAHFVDWQPTTDGDRVSDSAVDWRPTTDGEPVSDSFSSQGSWGW